jgi:hypothetical protein
VNPVADLTAAWTGLALIVAGKPEAATQFAATLNGLAVAVGWFVLSLVLGAAAQSVAVGMPRLDQVLFGLGIQAATLAVLFWATVISLHFLKLTVSPLGLFVPIVYILALMQVFAIPLILLGPNVQILAVLAAAVMVGRAGKVLAGMNTGSSIAFAFLSLMVLVLVPVALYMLFLQIPSPA